MLDTNGNLQAEGSTLGPKSENLICPRLVIQTGSGPQAPLSGQCQYPQEMDPADLQLAQDPQPVGHPFRGSVSRMSLAASFLPREAFALRASRACSELIEGVTSLLPLTHAAAQAGWFERLSGQFIMFVRCRLHKVLRAINMKKNRHFLKLILITSSLLVSCTTSVATLVPPTLTVTVSLLPQETLTPTILPSMSPTETLATSQSQKATILPPQEIEFDIIAQYGGTPSDMLVDGNMIFLAVGPRLLALDVADPSMPVKTGESDLLSFTCKALAIADERVFWLSDEGWLLLFDVSNPFDLRLLAEFSIDAGGEVVAVDRNVLFVGFKNALQLLDISNPLEPEMLSTLEIPGPILSIELDGNQLFVSTRDHILKIDASDPAQPVINSSTKVGRGRGIALALPYAYSFEPDLSIYDLSDPTELEPAIVTADNQDILSASISQDALVETIYSSPIVQASRAATFHPPAGLSLEYSIFQFRQRPSS